MKKCRCKADSEGNEREFKNSACQKCGEGAELDEKTLSCKAEDEDEDNEDEDDD